MSKRNTQQRRQLIVSMLMEQNELSVDYLAQFFDTSEVTIRKDLRVLGRRRFFYYVAMVEQSIYHQN